MSYTMYTPLNVWLDPASVTDVVAYIQNYLSENTIYSEEEIEELIHDYLIAHPELIGGVQSVNGKTGTVVLTASDINTANNVTIESVLSSLSSQISSIASSVATNTSNITNLTGRVTTAETDISNLKSSIDDVEDATFVNQNITFSASDIVQGSFTSTGAVSPNNNRIRIKGFIPVSKGDRLTFTGGTNAAQLLWGKFDAGKKYKQDSPFLYPTADITFDFDGFIIIVFKNGSGTSITPEQFDATCTMHYSDAPSINYDSIVRNISRIAYGLGSYGSGGVPQQTIAGYIKAYSLGYRIMLCDLRFTSDNVPICFHDAYLNEVYNNVTDGSGNLIPKDPPIYVANKTLAELQSYDVGEYIGPEFKGTKILTLAQMAALCRNLGCELYIEIKTNITTEQYDIVFSTLSNYRMFRMSTFSPQTIEQLNSLTSYSNYANINFMTNRPAGSALPDEYVDAIINATNENNRGHNSMAIGLTVSITKEQVTRLQMADIGLMIYADTAEVVDTFLARGEQYHCLKEVVSNYGFLAGKYLYQKQMRDKCASI